jgi:hypothetical protein
MSSPKPTKHDQENGRIRTAVAGRPAEADSGAKLT